MTDEPTLREKLHGIQLAAAYRPRLAATIIGVSLIIAVFEGIGLGFLLPIIETAQTGSGLAVDRSGAAGYFVRAYEIIGVPFTIETLMIGLAGVMTVRFALSFLSSYLQVKLRMGYFVYLRKQVYERLIVTDISFIEDRDDDDVMNTLVTETARSAGIISQLLGIVQSFFMAIAYVSIALLIAPALALGTALVLGVIVFLTRYVIQQGYDLGRTVAAGNERVQALITAGIRGLREIKLFNMSDHMLEEYDKAHAKLARKSVELTRNQAALSNFNQLLNAFALFILVYLTIGYLDLSFASLGVFLFAMFRLSPQISSLNNSLYSLDGSLAHLLQCHELIDELDRHRQPTGKKPAPSPVRKLELDDVTFQYDTGEDIRHITNVSLEFERDETVALVGPSGAGKSTIMSLITGLHKPKAGQILVNDQDLDKFDTDSWHDRIAVVAQDPYVFNETLRYNIIIGNPDASEAEIRRACEVSQVSSFLDTLPDGLDSNIGDDAVRLSGGQRQRVAIARALLKDADVLLLDEATSELDAPTEQAILTGIESMNREYLTVVVGHFLSTVQDADRIYTIVDGELVETGTHGELLKNESHYADLYSS